VRVHAESAESECVDRHIASALIGGRAVCNMAVTVTAGRAMMKEGRGGARRVLHLATASEIR
jgi:hypothetical protein